MYIIIIDFRYYFNCWKTVEKPREPDWSIYNYKDMRNKRDFKKLQREQRQRQLWKYYFSFIFCVLDQ